jgi:hypothetical protein
VARRFMRSSALNSAVRAGHRNTARLRSYWVYSVEKVEMHPSQFLANLNRHLELLPRIAVGSVRTILVARSRKSRLRPRPKLNEGPEGLQSFDHLRKRSFSTE